MVNKRLEAQIDPHLFLNKGFPSAGMPLRDRNTKNIKGVDNQKIGFDQAAIGRKRQSASPTVHGILAVVFSSPAMTAVVTDLPITGYPLTGGSGWTRFGSTAQFNVSSPRSGRSLGAGQSSEPATFCEPPSAQWTTATCALQASQEAGDLIAKRSEPEFSLGAAAVRISAEAAGEDSTRQRLQWVGHWS